VFVVLALFGYVFSVGKRLTSVQREVERLQGDIAGGAGMMPTAPLHLHSGVLLVGVVIGWIWGLARRLMLRAQLRKDRRSTGKDQRSKVSVASARLFHSLKF
jgi:hypothetical protein